MNKVICGDCLEVMKSIPDKSIDLVLTDPPYGISVDTRMHKTSNQKSGNGLALKGSYINTNWDNSIPEGKIFNEMFRVSKNQIIFGGNYFIENLHNSPCWIVWDKDNGTTNFADCELAWTSYSSPIRKFKYRWNGMLQEDMANKETRFHPTQKPVGLLERILDKYSKLGNTILDPFLGSGSTAIACRQLSRNFIGIEINPDYCKIAEDRLAQTELFILKPIIKETQVDVFNE